jgi:hypothetical protein
MKPNEYMLYEVESLLGSLAFYVFPDTCESGWPCMGSFIRGAYTGWHAGVAGTALVAGICRPREKRRKRTSLDLLRGFCCSYDIPSCCHVFFRVVFLLFVEVLWDVVELRVEH